MLYESAKLGNGENTGGSKLYLKQEYLVFHFQLAYASFIKNLIGLFQIWLRKQRSGSIPFVVKGDCPVTFTRLTDSRK